jgi:methyl-accepting chemotaxis protein
VTIDAVNRLELLVELFAQKASDLQNCNAPQREDESNSGFAPPAEALRSATLTLAEMLAGTQTLLEALSRSAHGGNDQTAKAVDRVAHFLTENADAIDEDAPRPPRLLHYVYPIV